MVWSLALGWGMQTGSCGLPVRPHPIQKHTLPREAGVQVPGLQGCEGEEGKAKPGVLSQGAEDFPFGLCEPSSLSKRATGSF